MHDYIKINKFTHKLDVALASHRHVMISATTGWGKTAAVKNYFRQSSHLWLSGAGGSLDKMPDPGRIKTDVIVVDDISWLEDRHSCEYLIDLIRTS